MIDLTTPEYFRRLKYGRPPAKRRVATVLLIANAVALVFLLSRCGQDERIVGDCTQRVRLENCKPSAGAPAPVPSQLPAIAYEDEDASPSPIVVASPSPCVRHGHGHQCGGKKGRKHGNH